MFIPRLLILTVIYFISFFSLTAQEKVIQDHLYLQDGSFLKGSIVARDTVMIRWKLTNGEIISIAETHVHHIQKVKHDWLVFPNGKIILEKGNYHIIFTGLLIGKGDGFQENPIGANLAHFIKGVKFNQFFSAGIGIGLDLYNHEFVPLYLDIRGDFLNQPITPYYAFNAGYGFALENNRSIDNKGGIMIHPAIGLRFASKKRVGYLLEIGYKFQNGKREFDNLEFTDELTYKRLSLRAGLSF